MNFAERRVEPEAIFGERSLNRLREIRANVDPDGLFHANHPIGVLRIRSGLSPTPGLRCGR